MNVDIKKESNKLFFIFAIVTIVFIVLVLVIDKVVAEKEDNNNNQNENVTFLSGVEGVWNVSWGNYSLLDEKVNTDIEEEDD